MKKKNWTVYKNPQIENMELLEKWCKSEFSRRGKYKDTRRVKIRKYKDDYFIKVKNNTVDFFEDMWLKTWPENAVVISTTKFYKEEYVASLNLQGWGQSLGQHIWSTDMRETNVLEWFTKEYGSEWSDIEEIYVDDKHWVDTWGFGDSCERTMNIVDTVFVFKFKTKSEAMRFKLIFDT